MLAADGGAIAGVVAGEPMHLLRTDDGVLVASEPHDDDPAWREVADGTVLHVHADGVTETRLLADR